MNRMPDRFRFWSNRIPQMRLEESMNDLASEFRQLGRRDFVEHPRDLDEGRPQIPETPDLFADGLLIAQDVLDWEERAGQPIAALIEHIKAAQQLRESVQMQAKRSVPEQGSDT